MDPRYVAVRQFSGFVSDYNVGEEAAALSASLEGTAWANAIEKSKEDGGVGADSAYTVAQYNSPFEFIGRVNEIWLPFQMDDWLSETLFFNYVINKNQTRCWLSWKDKMFRVRELELSYP